MASVFKAGHTALITGGASGIGLSLARKCTTHGMRVLVADWDDELLRAAPTNMGGPPQAQALLSTLKMDVSKPSDWALLKKRVDDDLAGHINLLALNAGIGPSSSWASPDAFQKILDVNLYGVIHGITTFLDTVKATPDRAAIVITGSKQGITNPPGNPAYNASKAAVKTLAEHLSFDLREQRDRLSVHLLVPGWTFTGLTGNRPSEGKEKPEGAWWPNQVVDFAEPKIEEGQFWILCPDGQVTEQLVSHCRLSSFLALSLLAVGWWKKGWARGERAEDTYTDMYPRTARECFGAHRMPLKAGLLSQDGETSGSRSIRIGLISSSKGYGRSRKRPNVAIQLLTHRNMEMLAVSMRCLGMSFSIGNN